MSLDEFLSLKEALEMAHLPEAGDEKDQRLCNTPPQHALVGGLGRLTESLLTVL